MNGAHIHLLFNHVPILGSVFALCLIAYGLFLKNNTVAKTGLVVSVIAALFSIVAFLSGEEAEHMVEGRLGVSETTIHDHEEDAEISYWAILMSGAIALGTIMASLKSRTPSNALLWVNLIVLAVVFVLMTRTGYSGGLIRHPEIDATAATASPNINAGGEHDDDD